MEISASFLSQDIEVYRPKATGSAGRFTNTYTKIGTYPGRLSGVNAGKRSRGGREEASYTDVLYLGKGKDIQRGDRIRRKHDGLEAVVTKIRTLSMDDHVEAEVERVAAGPSVSQLPEDV